MRNLQAGLAVAVAALATGGAPAAGQQPTTITVRVVSQDAKIIGDGVGGARVIIRDAESGEVLAAGVQQGATGDTERIVRAPRVRGEDVYDTPGAAAFTATLQLAEPTRVEVIGEGPLGTPHAIQRASATLLLVPGVDIGGDGLVLTLHGFLVELLEPLALPPTGEARVTARVRMLCGCPLEPGGLWDADRVEVTARVASPDGGVRTFPLRYAGEPNLFTGALAVDGLRAEATLTVVAQDARRVNFGQSATKPLR